ncbi:hypothetical protein DESUT3_19820 [Desulfuromonas versatilis]|uniref:Phosphoenolpyruvate synthase n=1 Tax=Desulfuromonas versatilis TaxID=2802975 RepID=A0ABM8HWJ7_9BACT|nr:PEP/pyruvate-binding domain-containing protein [Desulfuromonas versatilis]BCR04913.1 hypothetical protein DESUT3_19820 [Desulfuromonas versatilis]
MAIYRFFSPLFPALLGSLLVPAVTLCQTGPDLPFVREEISVHATGPLPDTFILRQWVSDMKGLPRGPFKRIRWFCSDGTVHPPRPYPCGDRGGGVQHGEWSDQTKRLRAHGWLIGNVLADIDAKSFTRHPGWENHLKQILLEQFLIDADNGWIFRRARYYRGALQAENEEASGRGILLSLLGQREWARDNFLVLREATRFIPHGRREAPLTEMRQLSTRLAEQDPEFTPLRIKLHVRPDPGDAAAVRSFAAARPAGPPDPGYEKLADLIDQVYRPRRLDLQTEELARSVKNPDLVRILRRWSVELSPENPPHERFAAAARALGELRHRFLDAGHQSLSLRLLHLSLDLEQLVFELANRRLDTLSRDSRRQHLDGLRATADALYGMGLLAGRQREALEESFVRLDTARVNASDYKVELEYLGRTSRWAEGQLHFVFSETLAHLERLDPRFSLYIPDRLRGSPLTAFVAVLDTLLAEANRMVGIRHELFGNPVAAGVSGLNPGLARGPLLFLHPQDPEFRVDPRGIYVIPETVTELSPVGGIISEGGGNRLSHLQMLARNFGIPNVALDGRLLDTLKAHEGAQAVLAVSPAGVVRLELDGPQWEGLFGDRQGRPAAMIDPDPGRLDLFTRGIIPLEWLRASDAGRIAGPKAANLGELKTLFPDLVPDGLVIPFGSFRELLEQPFPDAQMTAFSWLSQQHRLLRQLPQGPEREAMREAFLSRLRAWIGSADPGPEFRSGLREALARHFGAEGSYGVFVRSDTNVEDLPGFSGAGLNLTVPNVVGDENILQAIRQVWASPFTERAYRWRQDVMENPEHVYVSVLLMKSVAAEKSGVLVTLDVASGRRDRFSVAVNEGVGGAVAGQRAEELLIDPQTGSARLLAQAAQPTRNALLPQGGVARIPASGSESLLDAQEIGILAHMGKELPARFPGLVDAAGKPAPADIEFGFAGGRFVLFQIRPFLENPRARGNILLAGFDAGLQRAGGVQVEMNGIAEKGSP